MSTHCWPSLDCFSPSFQADARRMRVNAVNLVSRYEEYRAATAGEEVVAVDLRRQGAAHRRLGRRRLRRGLRRPRPGADDRLHVARPDPGRLGGRDARGPRAARVAGDQAAADVRRLLPPGRAARSRCGATPRQHGLPVLLHTGTTFVANAPLECTLPRHLDPVAIRFPDVKIILAHLGHPYEGEMHRRRSASTRTSTPTSAPCSIARGSSSTA